MFRDQTEINYEETRNIPEGKFYETGSTVGVLMLIFDLSTSSHFRLRLRKLFTRRITGFDVKKFVEGLNFKDLL